MYMLALAASAVVASLPTYPKEDVIVHAKIVLPVHIHRGEYSCLY
jgi:hypothetical protein